MRVTTRSPPGYGEVTAAGHSLVGHPNPRSFPRELPGSRTTKTGEHSPAWETEHPAIAGRGRQTRKAFVGKEDLGRADQPVTSRSATPTCAHSVTVKAEPIPTWLSTDMVPPCCSTMRCTIDNPSPLPST